MYIASDLMPVENAKRGIALSVAVGHAFRVGCFDWIHPSNEVVELPRLRHDLVCLAVGGHVRPCVVDHVALPSARFEVVGVRTRRITECKCDCIDGDLVVAGLGGDTVARARNSHVRGLKGSVVGRRKPPIRREPCDLARLPDRGRRAPACHRARVSRCDAAARRGLPVRSSTSR
jgi:hypothetical protein